MNRREFLGTLAAVGAGAFGFNRSRGKVVGGRVHLDLTVTKDSAGVYEQWWFYRPKPMSPEDRQQAIEMTRSKMRPGVDYG